MQTYIAYRNGCYYIIRREDGSDLFNKCYAKSLNDFAVAAQELDLRWSK